QNYDLSNDYISSSYNKDIFEIKGTFEIQKKVGGDGQICTRSGECLFSVLLTDSVVLNYHFLRLTILAIYLLSFIFLVTGLYLYSGSLVKFRKGEWGFLIYVTSVSLIRILVLYADFPEYFVDTEFFSAENYASSSLNPSLGDLLINVLLLFSFIYFLFRNYPKFRTTQFVLSRSSKGKFIAGVIIAISLFFTLWYPHFITQSIYDNSKITLDITQLDTINFPFVVGLIIIFISSGTMFIGFHFLFRLLSGITGLVYKRLIGILLLGGIIFSLIQIVLNEHYVIVLCVGIGYMLLLNYFKIFKNLAKWRYDSFLYIFSLICVSGILGVYGIYEFEIQREGVYRNNFAEYFLVRNDYIMEYYLDDANKRIDRDVFISTRMASPFLSKDAIAQKIKLAHLDVFFDKYDIDIYLLNTDKQLFEGTIDPELKKLLNDSSYQKEYSTDYDGIYYLNRLGTFFLKRYVDIVPIKRREVLVGYVMIDFRLKKIIPNDVYFELLVDSRFRQPFLLHEYSYGVFENDILTYYSGSYNYSSGFDMSILENDVLYNQSVKINGYYHNALKDIDGRVIVVSSPEYSYMKGITNFSFWFLIQVLIFSLAGGIIILYLSHNRFTINFAARIQIYFNLAFFLPMLFVSFITLSFINRSFKDEINYENTEKALNVGENMLEHLELYRSNIAINREELSTQLRNISLVAGADINLFNTKGKLMATTQPLIYENNLVSEYMNPKAFLFFLEGKGNQWTSDEFVGNLSYKNSYMAISSQETGKTIGILSLPFFESERRVEQQQLELLGIVINIFTIIFIVFLIISYLVSKGLTYPLRLITQQLKKTTLTSNNEHLKWDSSD
ncbi:MAG: hypothetical protein OEY34_07530, partial [Cyclobacteriaceae bacterium]|nr:hypothetical protein [Cyclobacteriaceae bacterium]